MESEEELDIGAKKHAVRVVRVWIVVGEGVGGVNQRFIGDEEEAEERRSRKRSGGERGVFDLDCDESALVEPEFLEEDQGAVVGGDLEGFDLGRGETEE